MNAKLRNRVKAIRIAPGVYEAITHLRMYILTEIDDCSEAGRREDLHADEKSAESFAG